MNKLKSLAGDISGKDGVEIPAGAPKPGGPIQGWLKKRGDKGIVLGWKPRFFKLTEPTKLSYSKDDAGTKTKGFIDLGAVTGVAQRNDIPNGFVVSVPGRSYILRAANAQDRSDWLAIFPTICPKLGGQPAAVPVAQTPPPAAVAATPQPAAVAAVGSVALDESSIHNTKPQLDAHMAYLGQVTGGAPWQFLCDYADLFKLLEPAQQQAFQATFGGVINDGYVRDLGAVVNLKLQSNPGVGQMLAAAVPSRAVRLIVVDDSYWTLLVQYGNFSRLRVHEGVLLIEVRRSSFGANMGTLGETFDPCFSGGASAPVAVAPVAVAPVQVTPAPTSGSRGIFDTFPEVKAAMDGISALACRFINFEVDMNRFSMACDKRSYNGRAGEVLGWYLKPLEQHLSKLILWEGRIDPEFSSHFNMRVHRDLIRFVVAEDNDPTAAGYSCGSIDDGVLTIRVRESYVGNNVDYCGSPNPLDPPGCTCSIQSTYCSARIYGFSFCPHD
eukprot:TRINITY_DN2081_c0_g2_i1.p1 TRINITY_DN2081_c0_g2~~TRINITY_DN2081_c0_g2_i1.p1  ORF type:complete len:497 (+),score=121.13 TRINITY_DN2081_c0_g2_i1:46-1536(+)